MFWSLIGGVYVLYIFIRFINQIGKSFPVMELMLIIAGLQWIIAPIISYNSGLNHDRYYMYVGEAEYMSYIVPAFIMFSGVILMKMRKIEYISFSKISLYSDYAKKLIIISVISDGLSIIAPASLAFLFFIISQFKFIGGAILLNSSRKTDKIWLYVLVGFLIIHALSIGMFHELLIWSVFYCFIIAMKKKPSFGVKITIVALGVLAIITLQMVKPLFRQLTWQDNFKGNKVEVFVNVLEEIVSREDSFDVNELASLNPRLNQGWIISAIMSHVPDVEPFADGKTIKEAITGSLLPRFLNSNKKVSGGREGFIRYTGLSLGESTSMALSIIGESYANFGKFGGIIFMTLWGLFLSVVWNRIRIKVYNNNFYFFFIPLVFFQVIKAETELLTVLNHLVKSIIVVMLFLFLVKRHLKWRI
jgi:hypothetical protein